MAPSSGCAPRCGRSASPLQRQPPALPYLLAGDRRRGTVDPSHRGDHARVDSAATGGPGRSWAKRPDRASLGNILGNKLSETQRNPEKRASLYTTERERTGLDRSGWGPGGRRFKSCLPDSTSCKGRCSPKRCKANPGCKVRSRAHFGNRARTKCPARRRHHPGRFPGDASVTRGRLAGLVEHAAVTQQSPEVRSPAAPARRLRRRGPRRACTVAGCASQAGAP
jgi:hypothetical protein